MFNPSYFRYFKMSKIAATRVGEAMAKLAAVDGLTPEQFVSCSQAILTQIAIEKDNDGYTFIWSLEKIIVNSEGYVYLGFEDLKHWDSTEYVFAPDGRRVIQI